jgi:MinD superfamily P-loop ATPase
VVTEPTPLGAHDAGLILKLLQIMKIPSETVLNKADLGDKKAIKEIAADYDAPIVIEIPYSDQLVKAYSEGRIDEMVDLI